MASRPAAYKRYVEPFAGSACLFFALRPANALLADQNASLIETYRVLREMPSEVAAAVYAWPTEAATYYRVRHLTEDDLPPSTRAARFIYLNRLCFNGVYRTNRLGQFNVPFGRRPGAIPGMDRFVACAEALGCAELTAADFEFTLEGAREGDFVYLDPPYSRAAGDAYGVYGYGSFNGTDLDRLVGCLQDLDAAGAQVMLSYAYSPQLGSLGSTWRSQQMSVIAQVGGPASRRSTRREMLITNYDVDP